MQEVEAVLSEDLKDTLRIEDLEGKTIQETLYVQAVEKREGKIFFVVIFTKVPNKLPLATSLNNLETTFFWQDVVVEPVEIPQGFLFGDFTIPEPMRFLAIILSLISLGVFFILGRRFYRKFQEKKKNRARRLELWEKIMSVKNFEEVVSVWQNKHLLLREFPHLDEPFKSLEKVLFRYQFKPHQTPEEKEEVIKAYRHFQEILRGGRNGI